MKVKYDKPAEQDLVLLNVPAGRVFEFKGGIPVGQFLRTKSACLVDGNVTYVDVSTGFAYFGHHDSQVRLLDAELVITS